MISSILILYGSQTGNAQDVAERISRESKFLDISPRILPLDSYDVSELPRETAVVFIVSTAGQVAAKKLYRRLCSLGATACLDLGLGDDQHPSGYEAALDTWLPRMWDSFCSAFQWSFGMRPDDQGQLVDLGLPKYKVTFLTATSSLPVIIDLILTEEQRLQAAVEAAAAFRRVSAQASGQRVMREDETASVSEKAQFGPSHPFLAPVLENRRITSSDHFQDVRHIALSLRGSGTMECYEPGDLVNVWPLPEASLCEAFLSRLGLDGDTLIQVQANDPPAGCHLEVSIGTIRSFIEGVLDVTGASPRRRFFQVLSHFTPDTSEIEKERLSYFSSVEGRDDLYRYNQREGRSVLEVLQDFKSANPPLEWLLETCPLMKARQFSISSSSRMHPGEAHLTVAVVDWNTPYKRRRRGLCSSYLANAAPVGSQGLGQNSACSNQHSASKVAVWVEKGSLRMPMSLLVPLILIGPGTGVAPFRSFLQHRAVLMRCRANKLNSQSSPLTSEPLKESQPSSDTDIDASCVEGGNISACDDEVEPAPCSLFFGCRYRDKDCYYEEEFRKFQQDGVLTQGEAGFCVAGSRDQPQKVYVTNKLMEHELHVWKLLENHGAHVYVSGSAQKMPSDVLATFESIVTRKGGMSMEEAKQYMRQLEFKGRYHVEAWS
ncbi:hypothetical protein CEUSTIGMA_g1628.t1 [Chlamydomonas eustigma]|uniref:FAD-binding FR-type domain-containing protein n=1 Tax=Chlamydomonas eustigma TaxID=1157962 RepID=A0A250WTX1_9CHLO|nr:hypothetical protein CEUSTIGMA_g1628.t1 [Chlamydomonas eustigma]|eukprot:GAX74179.1 hypothetical protein CEUSTIGMA_g1628.t1 [Chlamydomonas eustigma]